MLASDPEEMSWRNSPFQPSTVETISMMVAGSARVKSSPTPSLRLPKAADL